AVGRLGRRWPACAVERLESIGEVLNRAPALEEPRQTVDVAGVAEHREKRVQRVQRLCRQIVEGPAHFEEQKSRGRQPARDHFRADPIHQDAFGLVRPGRTRRVYGEGVAEPLHAATIPHVDEMDNPRIGYAYTSATRASIRPMLIRTRTVHRTALGT